MKESQIARNISATFTSIPALLFAAFSLTAFRGEYFWLPYALVSVVFLIASALLGVFLPLRLGNTRLNRFFPVCRSRDQASQKLEVAGSVRFDALEHRLLVLRCL